MGRGLPATGKTRFLNTIFNVCRFVASDEFRSGCWDITFLQEGKTYQWILECGKVEKSDEEQIIKEELWKIENGEKEVILKRDKNSFVFVKQSLPIVNPRLTGISVFKKESIMQPIFKGFENVLRRRFFSDDLAKNITQLEIITTQIINKYKDNIDKLIHSELCLNSKLFILHKYFPRTFAEIGQYYKEAFPFVENVSFESSSNNIFKETIITAEIPMFCIKEKGSHNKIALPELSSGMQKVLLILTDIYILPKESIYLIDEYENSLGINAIDFFPDVISNLEKEIQFLITSHHPYIINKIPPKNWYVFHRKGKPLPIVKTENGLF